MARLGATHVFSVAGGHLMHLMDSIVNRSGLKYVAALHEQAASMMAKSHARAREQFSVCMVTSGPGGTNAITGCASAWTDSTPVLFLSGQFRVETLPLNTSIRGSAPQQYFPIPLVESITKYSALILKKEDVAGIFVAAIQAMISGRPGPVWLDIPLDIQGAKIMVDVESDCEAIVNSVMHHRHKLLETFALDDIQKIHALLLSSKRPVILAGQGVRLSKSIEKLSKLVETTQIPLLTTISAMDLYGSENDRWFGRPGLYSQRSTNFIIQNSDLLISLGAGLHYETTGFNSRAFARSAFKIVVDIDPNELEKDAFEINLKVNLDCSDFLNFISDLDLSNMHINEWVQHCRNLRKKYSVPNDSDGDFKDVNLHNFFKALSKSTSTSDKIVLGNAGFHAIIGWQSYRQKTGQRLIHEVGAGVMGHSLPSAIGIAFAFPGERVICVTGDGGIQVNLQELQTVLTYKLPLKIFIVANGGYMSLVNTQRKYFDGRLIGSTAESGLSLPNFSKLLEAYGFSYNEIYNLAELEKKMIENLRAEGAFVSIVHTDPEARLNPAIQTKLLPDGNMISAPLEEMSPELPEEEFLQAMLIPRYNPPQGDRTDETF